MSPRPTAFLGVDIGSTELRTGLVTVDGRLLGLERARHAMDVEPGRGHAEQDAGAWWTGLVHCVRALVARVDVDVAGIAVDGHGPTLTPVDRLGRPTRRAITWLDQRARRDEDELSRQTGLRGWALGILPAARWVGRHEPEVEARTSWYLNSWEALTLRLTREARTSLAADQSWPSGDTLAALGLPVTRFAPPIAAGEVAGTLHRAAAGALGLPAGTPVVAGLVDAFASFHGAGMLRAGDAIDVGGSAGGFGVYWDLPVQAAGSFTTPAPLAGHYVVGGAMAALGRSVEWLRDLAYGRDGSIEVMLDEASGVAPGADGLLFLPYLAGERSPIWDPDARGAFVGLTLRHGRADLARAVLEATALALRHVAEPILAGGVRVGVMRVAGGPARSDAWNQIKADISGFPVEVPRILETAVTGAAIVAATGTGAHPNLSAAIAGMTAIERRLEPNADHREIYDKAYAAYVSLHPAIAPVLRQLRPRAAVAVS